MGKHTVSAGAGEEEPMNPPIAWLLEGEPFVAYRTRIDLLGQSAEGPETSRARAEMLCDPRVTTLVDGLRDWPGTVIASHKSASQPFHRLRFLADLGLSASDPGIAEIAEKVMSHRSAEGAFQVPLNVSGGYGGDGEHHWAWALCDAPLHVATLARFGLRDDPRVITAAEHIAGLVSDNGWHCVVSEELGKFRGPGRKDDPCPFATLATLEALLEFDRFRNGDVVAVGAETLLGLWEHSREVHPYQFYMGTDFRKLKAPFIWYDILHVAEVLSRCERFVDDARLREMVAVITSKLDSDGRATAESVWQPWKGWEFVQKSEPSRWKTLLVWRILARLT
jgi:hypothetical protein